MSDQAPEIVAKAQHEVASTESCPESPQETTQEIFRREDLPETPKSQCHLAVPALAKTTKSPNLPTKPKAAIAKTPSKKVENNAMKKKSNSGIPLRLKSGTSTTVRPQAKQGTYRHPQSAQTALPVLNKNTLEMQFMNNKKRLMQLHAELAEKQRPLIDMHKSLMRTKKQLEDLGKKVVLEDIKVISLKGDGLRSVDDQGAGETPAAEAAMHLKSSIDDVLDTCVKVCQKCFVKRDDMVKMLESISRSEIESANFDAEVEELKREKEELEKSIETSVCENEKKITELIANWQKSARNNAITEEMAAKVSELEDKLKQQQKIIADAEDNAHSLNRKIEDRKMNYEKTIAEFQEKINKLEEELKKEKKTAIENLTKSRTLRGKLTDLEAKTKETEEKSNETATKLKQLQEKMRLKEIQWIKEKDDFKKNEQLLQQKFTEKQSQFDTRLKELTTEQKHHNKENENLFRAMETELEVKEQQLLAMETERDELDMKTKKLEEEIEIRQKQIQEKDKEIEEMNIQREATIAAIEYKSNEDQWGEIMEYKRKISEVQNTLKQQTDQISKMQSSLKAHAQLAVALKLEKDNAIKYSNKIRDILQEARDEIEYKNRTIYKIHEKLVLKEASCEKLKAELKEIEACSEYSADAHSKPRCQICMSTMVTKNDCSSCVDTEVGKLSGHARQMVSESLIGMSVKKVDNLRARLDNLKKIKLPVQPAVKKTMGAARDDGSWANQSCEVKPINNSLKKQIELRGKLYKILQKHADQSCEDFINLLKLTVSNSGKNSQGLAELKPSNLNIKIDETVQFASPNIKIAKSFQYLNAMPLDSMYRQLDESFLENEDTDMDFN